MSCCISVGGREGEGAGRDGWCRQEGFQETVTLKRSLDRWGGFEREKVRGWGRSTQWMQKVVKRPVNWVPVNGEVRQPCSNHQ